MSSSSRKKDRKSKGEWSLKKVRVGDVVDVKDAKGQWHEGRVHDTDQSNKCVEVYFHGMDIPTGQWSDKESVAPHRTHTTDAWREQLMKREAAFAGEKRPGSGVSKRPTCTSVYEVRRQHRIGCSTASLRTSTGS